MHAQIIFTDKCVPSKNFGDHWLSGLLFYRFVTVWEAFVLNLFHSSVDITTSFLHYYCNWNQIRKSSWCSTPFRRYKQKRSMKNNNSGVSVQSLHLQNVCVKWNLNMEQGTFCLSGHMEWSGNTCRLPSIKISTPLFSIRAVSLTYHKSLLSQHREAS